MKRSFTHGPGIDEVLGMTDYTGESPVDYFFHHDGMGSIVNITDASQLLKTTYTYNPFGEFTTTYNNGTIDSPFTFTGREFSSSTGLYHYRARNYLPGIGQFTSRDPYPYDTMSPNTIQRYNYCGNSPVNFVDPWGLRYHKEGGHLVPDGQTMPPFSGFPIWGKDCIGGFASQSGGDNGHGGSNGGGGMVAKFIMADGTIVFVFIKKDLSGNTVIVYLGGNLGFLGGQAYDSNGDVFIDCGYNGSSSTVSGFEVFQGVGSSQWGVKVDVTTGEITISFDNITMTIQTVPSDTGSPPTYYGLTATQWAAIGVFVISCICQQWWITLASGIVLGIDIAITKGWINFKIDVYENYPIADYYNWEPPLIIPHDDIYSNTTS